jgi:hypothetical protein
MHPELLRAIGKARHDDLLEEHRARGQPRRIRHHDHSPRFSRSRHRVGTLLIWAGARLLRDQQAALELAHK